MVHFNLQQGRPSQIYTCFSCPRCLPISLSPVRTHHLHPTLNMRPLLLHSHCKFECSGYSADSVLPVFGTLVAERGRAIRDLLQTTFEYIQKPFTPSIEPQIRCACSASHFYASCPLSRVIWLERAHIHVCDVK